MKYWIDTRDKPALLHALMKQLSDNAFISFEGWLKDLGFESIAGAATEETETLKRSTIDPQLDFVVLPLNDSTVRKIWKIISEKDHLVNPRGIIHVQIEKNGKLAFGGYDNFHRDCVVVCESVPLEILRALEKKGVIRSYREASEGQHR